MTSRFAFWIATAASVAIAVSLFVSLKNVDAADTPHEPTPESANELYAKADWAKAALAYSALTEREPAKGLYWYRLGACRLALKDNKPALAAFEKALANGAPEGQVRFNSARAHARLGEKESALDCLEKSAKIGFAKLGAVDKEEDFATLRKEERFRALIDKLEHPTKGVKGADALDHWIGEWDVFVGDKLVGHNRIVSALNGYAVEESWDGSSGGGGRGRSLFVFLAAKGQWKQLWTSDGGWVVEKIGTPTEGGIYLEGTSTFANGTVKKSRENLTKNRDGSVRQLLEDWDEPSKTWKPTFDAKYVRKATK